MNVFFPPYCVACQNYLERNGNFESICDICFLKIKEASYQFTVARPLDRIIGYGYYTDPLLRILIDRFKYRNVKTLAHPLGELICRALEEAGVEQICYNTLPVITFIPSHPLWERLRGYNHSQLLAFHIAEHFSLPILPLLERSWLNPRQALLKDKEERSANIKGSFKTLTERVPQKLLLIDDVWTSGATMKEASRILRRRGAKIIWGAVIASAS